jgi:NADPH:quinone reductase-like Zn-dependent oxidoreductase
MTRHHTQTMRAVILHGHGGPETLAAAGIPHPVPGLEPDRFGKVVLECRST